MDSVNRAFQRKTLYAIQALAHAVADIAAHVDPVPIDPETGMATRDSLAAASLSDAFQQIQHIAELLSGDGNG